MNRLTVALCAMALSTSMWAQDPVRANAEKLIAQALGDSKSYDTLAYLTDHIGPRLSGSDNAAAAVQWTTERFKAWGIPVRQEKVMVPHWVRGEERGRLVSHRNQKLILTAIGGSVPTPPQGITAEVIEVNSFDELKTLGKEKIKGKIVLYNNPMDLQLVRSGRAFDAYGKAVEFRGKGASEAAPYGAVAVVIYSVASATLRTPHTGALRYEPADRPKIPAAALTVEDALLIHRLLAKGEKVRMHLVLTPKILPDVASANVIAELKGTERPDEIVLIGAHLDSWDLGTGAIDDGTGVAMVMETMRLLKTLNIPTKRTIRCVLFMNEENGLNGGRRYYENRKSNLAQHVVAIESDAGSGPPKGFLTTLKGDALTLLKSRTEVLNRIAPITFETTKETGADTSFLVDNGVPGFALMPDGLHYFDYHHTPADTLDKVDPKHLAQNTATVAALAYVIADSTDNYR